MDGTLAGSLHLLSSRKEEKQGNQMLVAEIEQVIRSIESASANFNYQSDPDLVEACIYEMQALAARYRYLTKEARRQGVTKKSLLSLKQLER